MARTDFPNDAVCFILADIPGQGEFQGSGVIIGPHTVLTAAHLLYDADTDATADRVSIYPGYEPSGGTYNPTGALPGLQSIHTIKVPDYGEELSAVGSQRDFAVINTSTDLSAYGAFALDPTFTSGDVVVNGYPVNNDGNQAGTGGVLSQDGSLSTIDTSSLALAPGYSGGPIWDRVERGGAAVPAVVGLVSTQDDAMKLTGRKIALIRYWIAVDDALYAGGTDVPRGLTPQIDGTVGSAVNRAPVSAAAATLAAALITGEAAPGGTGAGAFPEHHGHGVGWGGHGPDLGLSAASPFEACLHAHGGHADA